MKNLIMTLFFVLASLSLEAQVVAIVDYMKVPEGGDATYTAIEKQWKAVHQSRVESGKILAWSLWYVRNSGAASTYNYTTVTLYENFGKTEAMLTDAELQKAFGAKMDDILSKTNASRSLIYSEMIRQEASIKSDVQDKFIVVNWIKTDNVGDYLNMEKVGYMPLHQEAKNQGLKNSWRIWTRWPNEDNSFQAAAVDGYSSYAQINNVDLGVMFEKIMAGKKTDEIWNMTDQYHRTDNIRSIVKTEIWEYVDGIAPKK
jgi:hypothetical protein